jgi:hypothetical protein
MPKKTQVRVCGDLVSKDGEDSLGRLAGLKGGKERVGREVFLGLSFVRFQRSVEMDTKLECEVDVEGTVDMLLRKEGRGSISSRPISAVAHVLPPRTRVNVSSLPKFKFSQCRV